MFKIISSFYKYYLIIDSVLLLLHSTLLALLSLWNNLFVTKIYSIFVDVEYVLIYAQKILLLGIDKKDKR